MTIKKKMLEAIIAYDLLFYLYVCAYPCKITFNKCLMYIITSVYMVVHFLKKKK